jgi:hypothetical protein
LAVVSAEYQYLVLIERLHGRVRHGEPELTGQAKAEMLIDLESVEILLSWRFEDMGRGRRARGNPPPASIMKERHLGLRARQAELPTVARESPGPLPLEEIPNSFRHLRVTEPLDMALVMFERGLQAARRQEPHRARAFLPHVGEEYERIPGGDLKTPRPILQNAVVVREETLHERTDDGVAVLTTGQWHREGKRIGIPAILPRCLVGQHEIASSALLDGADDMAADEHLKLRHDPPSFFPPEVLRPSAARPRGSPFRVSAVRLDGP